MNVAKLTGAQLSWAFGIASGVDPDRLFILKEEDGCSITIDDENGSFYTPLISHNLISDFWNHRGATCSYVEPNKHRIPSNALGACPETHGYLASIENHYAYGSTAAEAICRVFVFKTFGSSVELPEELDPTEEESTNDDQ